MQYREYLPHPALRRHIKCFWGFTVDPISGTQLKQPFLSEGGMELIFSLEDPFQIQHADKRMQTVANGCLMGAMTCAKWACPTGATAVLGVCFRPGGAGAFLSLAADELTDRCVNMEDILGATGRALFRQLRRSSLPLGAKITRLDNYFLNRLASRSRDEEIAFAVQSIVGTGGQGVVRDVARQAGLSVRQLERAFKARVGVSPKQFSRLIRFKSALCRVVRAPDENKVWAALDCGYYDQSHFNHEFKAFTGLNPTAYQCQQPGMELFFPSAAPVSIPPRP